MSARRVGLFGGTFDPVHLGHLVAATEVRHALELERVLFVPAGAPPHKPGAPISDAAHRWAMLELAVADDPDLALSRVDLDRPGPHYTVDMLRRLRAELGMPAGEDDLWFVMGADSLWDLPTWRDPAGILAQARLAVVHRPGVRPDLAALEAVIPGLGARVDLVAMPLIGISGTDLRRRVAEGRPIDYQVPRAVAAYIRRHGLYRPVETPSRRAGGRG